MCSESNYSSEQGVGSLCKFRLAIIVGTLIMVLCGCTVGPDFVRPSKPAIDHYSVGTDPKVTVPVNGQSQRFNVDAELVQDWWRLFKSSELDSLINTELEKTPTLAAALASLKQSEANLNAGKGVFFPQLETDYSFARQRITSSRLGIEGSATVFNLHTLSGSVSYVLDVFGGERRMVEGLAAQVDGQHALVRATYLSLIGNIINTSIAEAAYRAQVETTERLIALQRQQLDLVETQAKAGLISTSDVLAVRTQLAANEAVLPTIWQRQTAALDLLATLLGNSPAEAKIPKLSLANISLPTDIPVSLPSNLVRQRPDILLAESNLHLASAQVGIATAALFPTFTLSGTYGGESPQFGNLSNPNNRFWSIGPNVTFPVFQGGSGWYQKKAAEAAYEAALAKYRQTVLAGFAQVADTLHALTHDAEIAAARQQTFDLAQETLELMDANHSAGLVADQNSLVARQQMETARIAMIDAVTQRYQDTVALYVALGGGWWNSLPKEDLLRSSSSRGQTDTSKTTIRKDERP